jgi:hypothetical protein
VRAWLAASALEECRRDRERLLLARAAQADAKGFAQVWRALQ